ncbi:hypothetical protein K502DRAFT_92257 [Neoconidiobolus thromboides FSU 785]|nr:hypothetical protein K502DRAFT_92257 [Neoconidiobolus thromboides FSU 785]
MSIEYTEYIAISTISLLANLLIIRITRTNLNLKDNLELTTGSIIVINNTIFYLIVILLIAIVENTIMISNRETSISTPIWYFALKSSVVVTNIITSIELAALLSIIRYSKIY